MLDDQFPMCIILTLAFICSRPNLIKLAGSSTKVVADRACKCIMAMCAMSVDKHPRLFDTLVNQLTAEKAAPKLQYVAAASGLIILARLHGSNQFNPSDKKAFCGATIKARDNKHLIVREEGLGMQAAMCSIDETRASKLYSVLSEKSKSFTEHKSEKDAEWNDGGRYKCFLDTGEIDILPKVRLCSFVSNHYH